MGDPIKIRKKYSKPAHPWEKSRIEEETAIINKYALANKKEIWKMNSMLKGFKNEAKKLGSLTDEQSKKEKDLLLKKLVSMALLKAEDKMESILTTKLEDLIERRLQTIVYRMGLARSMLQARQFIVHRHIKVDNKVITAPSYIVLKKEESLVRFSESSSLADPENPERKIAKPVESKKTQETKKVKKSD